MAKRKILAIIRNVIPKRRKTRQLTKGQKRLRNAFLKEKNRQMQKLEKSKYAAIHPSLKNLITKLNRIPSAYAFDPYWNKIFDVYGAPISLAEAMRSKEIGFAPASVRIALDPTSTRAAEFANRLANFGKKFPKAEIQIVLDKNDSPHSIHILSHKCEEISSRIRDFFIEKKRRHSTIISGKELGARLKESKKFMDAVEKFVGKFPVGK